nr:DUF5131 family protein [uncultured Sphaerochaeta sp.]
MQKTKIEWCDSTWNPVTGCLHGCNYCYAKKIAERFGKDLSPAGCGIAERREPMYHETKNGKWAIAPYPFGFRPTFHRYRLGEPQKIKNPQRIFVVSMGDLFGDWVPDHWITEVFDACKKAPQHKYMFLTKNPKRYAELAEKGLLPELDNFWYGQTCVKGEIHSLLGPQYNEFLSAEPLQGVVDPWGFKLVIIGTETGNRKGKYIPTLEEVQKTSDNSKIATFMKDSCLSVEGVNYLIRMMPYGLMLEGETL